MAKGGGFDGFGGRVAALLVGAAVLFAAPALAQGQTLAQTSDNDYETPPVFAADSFLPPANLSNALYQVEKEVRNDGYMNHYSLKSTYGDYHAVGWSQLQARINEVNALYRLERVSKSKVFLRAAADAGISQLKTIKRLITSPVETISGIPAGLGRLFTRIVHTAGKGADIIKSAVPGGGQDVAGKAAAQGQSKAAYLASQTTELGESIVGINAAERDWARKLRIDPYTRNPLLREALENVAYVQRAGRIGAGIFMPSIPGMSYMSRTDDLVYSTYAAVLLKQNYDQLTAMGVEEAVVEALRANKSFNLTSRTAVVQALLAMEDAEGRPAMVALMAAAQNIPEAEFQVASLNLLSAYHVLERPLSRVVTEAGFPVAVTADNRLVAALAVEYVPWTAGIAATLDRITELAPARQAASRELWLGGQASSRCRRELESRGWTVHESSFERLKN